MDHKPQTTGHKIRITNQKPQNISVPCSAVCAPFRRGFSLVETIVAIAVLSFAMVGPLTLAQRGLNSSIYAKEQVTAFYLAQEAVEYVRNIRDNNNLLGLSKSASWLQGLEECISPKQCGIDVTANSSNQQVFTCVDDLKKDCQLTFNSSDGIYGVRRDNSANGTPVGGWQDTVFTRKIKITPAIIGGDPEAREADITATVSWKIGKTGSLVKSVTVSAKIFDWYPAQ